jgi:hypothetical protein
MDEKRFYISRDGKMLTDRKKETTLSVVKFRVVQKGKISSVIFNEGCEGKRQEKIARHTIDESAFNFGKATTILPTRKGGPVLHQPPAGSADPVPTKLAGSIVFTKEELIDLHQAHLEAANLTLRKLAAYIKANG